MNRKLQVALAAGATVALSAVNCFAVSIVEYSTLGSAVNAELAPAIAAAIPIMGTILAVGVGLKTIKRFIH